MLVVLVVWGVVVGDGVVDVVVGIAVGADGVGAVAVVDLPMNPLVDRWASLGSYT